MTDPDIPADASLLRCAVKKSWHVTKKLGLWLGGIAVVLIAAYVVWLGATSSTAATVWAEFLGWCSSAAGIVAGFIALVPWELWAVIVAVAAIFGYSLLWCMARNLTDEDWESETAKNTTFALALFALFAFALALTFAFAFALALFALALALTFAFALVLALALALTFADSKAFLFIGAYLHYRERIKAGVKKE